MLSEGSPRYLHTRPPDARNPAPGPDMPRLHRRRRKAWRDPSPFPGLDHFVSPGIEPCQGAVEVRWWCLWTTIIGQHHWTNPVHRFLYYPVQPRTERRLAHYELRQGCSSSRFDLRHSKRKAVAAAQVVGATEAVDLARAERALAKAQMTLTQCLRMCFFYGQSGQSALASSPAQLQATCGAVQFRRLPGSERVRLDAWQKRTGEAIGHCALKSAACLLAPTERGACQRDIGWCGYALDLRPWSCPSRSNTSWHQGGIRVDVPVGPEHWSARLRSKRIEDELQLHCEALLSEAAECWQRQQKSPAKCRGGRSLTHYEGSALSACKESKWQCFDWTACTPLRLNARLAMLLSSPGVDSQADVFNPPRYLATRVVLGGGLNNMLMHVAQLISAACAANQTLVLPQLRADPLSPSGGCRSAVCQTYRSVGSSQAAFGDIFDLKTFQGRMRASGCTVVDRPRAGAHVEEVNVTKISDGWWRSVDPALLRQVYSAARPSATVASLVKILETVAREKAGERWAAVHLPIEQDWWWTSDFCRGRVHNESMTRRCFAPSEVAALTAPMRVTLGATGVVLLYAMDKVDPRGPPVCPDHFAPRRTAKLVLPAVVPYTYRNAAEQFLAVRAPGGFFGNSFSTFSKGVALMRSAAALSHLHWGTPAPLAALPQSQWRNESFAYDCALPASLTWRNREDSVVLKHPGFELLRTLPGACRPRPPPRRQEFGGLSFRELRGAR
jgi:hypothetical protein